MPFRTTISLLTIIALGNASAQVKLRSRAGAILPPRLDVEWVITSETGDNALEPEEKGVLVVRVKNLGGEARDVTVRLLPRQALRGLIADSVAVIKAVPSQEIGEATLNLFAAEDALPESVRVQLSIDERSRSYALTRDVVIPIVESPGPGLILGQYMINNFVQGSDGAALTKGKETSVELEVRNTGARKARDVAVKVSANNPLQLKSSAVFPLGDMLIGDKRYVTISALVQENTRSNRAILTVRIEERRPKFSREYEVAIPLRASKEKRSSSNVSTKKR